MAQRPAAPRRWLSWVPLSGSALWPGGCAQALLSDGAAANLHDEMVYTALSAAFFQRRTEMMDEEVDSALTPLHARSRASPHHHHGKKRPKREMELTRSSSSSSGEAAAAAAAAAAVMQRQQRQPQQAR